MSQDIKTYLIAPHNEKGQRHGYWERNWSSGALHYKGRYFNEDLKGYWESYSTSGKLHCKLFYLI